MEAIGTLAAILTTISFVPQAIKVIKTNDTKGLSLAMYICLTSGVFLWMLYGILTHDRPIFVANAITLVFTVIILTILIKNTIKDKNTNQ